MNILNPFWVVVDPLNNIYTPAGDELWSNPLNWSLGHVPLSTETATIDGGNITLDITTTVNKLVVSATRTLSANGTYKLTVNDDTTVAGTVNFTGFAATLAMGGLTNSIASYTSGTTSTIEYVRAGAQPILNLTYRHLGIYGSGIKSMTSDLTLGGNLIINNFGGGNSAMECGAYNLTVTGTTTNHAGNSSGYGISKSGAGNILFIGAYNGNSNTTFSSAITKVEFRSNITLTPFGGVITLNCPVEMTTANKTLAGTATFNNTVTIIGAITVNQTGTMTYSGTVNGTVSGSTLTNNGTIYLATSILPMATGIFNYMTGANSIVGYVMNGDFTLPFITYNNLVILGTGIKSLSGNTTAKNLEINRYGSTQSKLQCGTYNLTMTGTTAVNGSGAALLKSDSGLIIFTGLATFNANSFDYNSDVTLEFRGGASLLPFAGSWSGSMRGTTKFTTSAAQNFNGALLSFTGPIEIGSGITLSIISGGVEGFRISDITGVDGTSVLKMAGFISYMGASQPMPVGVLDSSSTANTFRYAASITGQDVKAGTYRNLILMSIDGATSSVKKLLGNVSVVNTYTLTAPASLDSNGFALTNP